MARVILIDDDPAFGKAAVARLVADGHEVTFNVGPFGAVAAVCQGVYDLILIDVLMPCMDGTKLMEYLPRRRVGAAPVLLVSSIAEDKLRDLVAIHGADGYAWKNAGLDHLCHPGADQFQVKVVLNSRPGERFDKPGQ